MKEIDKITKLPVFYHQAPNEVAEEIMHSFDVQAVLDCTASDGSWAMACIRARKPYAGVCFTEAHVTALTRRLELLVFRGMQNESGPLCQPALVEVLKKKTKGQKTTRTTADVSPEFN